MSFLQSEQWKSRVNDANHPVGSSDTACESITLQFAPLFRNMDGYIHCNKTRKCWTRRSQIALLRSTSLHVSRECGIFENAVDASLPALAGERAPGPPSDTRSFRLPTPQDQPLSPLAFEAVPHRFIARAKEKASCESVRDELPEPFHARPLGSSG